MFAVAPTQKRPRRFLYNVLLASLQRSSRREKALGERGLFPGSPLDPLDRSQRPPE
jgi:hypothetical protein